MPLPLIALAVCCGAPVVLAGAAWLATRAREARGAERPASKEQTPANQTSASGLPKQAGGERRR